MNFNIVLDFSSVLKFLKKKNWLKQNLIALRFHSIYSRVSDAGKPQLSSSLWLIFRILPTLNQNLDNEEFRERIIRFSLFFLISLVTVSLAITLIVTIWRVHFCQGIRDFYNVMFRSNLPSKQSENRANTRQAEDTESFQDRNFLGNLSEPLGAATSFIPISSQMPLTFSAGGETFLVTEV